MSSPQALHKFFVDPDEVDCPTLVVTRGPLAGRTIKVTNIDGAQEAAGQHIELTFYYDLLSNDSSESIREFRKGDTPTLDDTHKAVNEVIVAYILSITGDDDGDPPS